MMKIETDRFFPVRLEKSCCPRFLEAKKQVAADKLESLCWRNRNVSSEMTDSEGSAYLLCISVRAVPAIGIYLVVLL